MKTSLLALHLCATLAIALAVAGCSGGTASPIAPPGAMPASSLLHRNHQASHIQPNSASLVYVSEWTAGQVLVYHYPSLHPAGVIQESLPFGLCVNGANGDVYVVDRDTAPVVDGYHHGATTPFTTLSLGSAYPISCAVDATTGNLAVTTDITVAIYLGGTGSPTFVPSSIGNMWGAGYDPSGNLWLSGQPNSCVASCYAEISHTNPVGPMVPVTLQATIANPGGVQWDGHHMTIGDQYASTIWKVKPNGHTFGTASLPGAVEVPFYDVLGQKVVATDRNLHKFYLYNYVTGTLLNSVTLPPGDVTGIGISQ